MHWLDALDSRADAQQPTLVLCRSAATVALVRRHVARAGGALGLQVLTPLGLASAVAPQQLLELTAQEPDWPQNGLWARVGERNGLRRQLLDHLERARLLQLDPQDPDFADLHADQWPVAEHTRHLLDLLALAQLRGANLAAQHNYARVVAIGFADADLPDATGLAPYEDALLRALGAQKLAAAVDPEQNFAVPVTKVADVVAEARLVTRYAQAHAESGADLGSVLVLVASAADGDRVRAALARAGLPSADDDARALREHGLCALLGHILPWFGAPATPRIEGDTLRQLLQSRLLKHSWSPEMADLLPALHQDIAKLDLPPRGTEVEVDPADPAAEDTQTNAALYLSRRAVPKTLSACRLVRATAAKWQQVLQDLYNDTSQDVSLRRDARIIAARLQWLQTCAQKSTLGAILAFIRGFGVRTWLLNEADGLALAVLRALANAKNQPATAEVLDDVLGGASSAGRVDDGVVVLPYARYDGRDAQMLILTGLHSKGIGRVPAADAFFDGQKLRKLGILQGAAFLDATEALLCAAVRRAAKVTGIAAERDATGRKVSVYLHLSSAAAQRVPKVSLGLWHAKTVGASYGLGMDGAENADLSALEVIAGGVPADLPQRDDAAADAARQATLEWLRCGATLAGSPAPELPENPTVLDILAAHEPCLPPWSKPWLGDVSHAAAAKLPMDQVLSVTYAFEPMTHCMYQAFASLRLRLRDADTLSEELDAKEIGSATHKALEILGKEPLWRVLPEQLENARNKLARALAEETGKEMAKMTAHSQGLQHAQAGMVQRWAVHWQAYVQTRVQAIGQAPAKGKAPVADVLFDGPIAMPYAEWSFGKKAESPWLLQLGDESVPVTGSIDLLRSYGDASEGGVEVLDYKTARTGMSAKQLQQSLELAIKPQTSLYALVVQQATAQGLEPFGRHDNLRFRVGYDFIKVLTDKGLLMQARTQTQQDALASVLGQLVRKARDGAFLALPHPQTCPMLQDRGHDYCQFASVCRLRALPGAAGVGGDDERGEA